MEITTVDIVVLGIVLVFYRWMVARSGKAWKRREIQKTNQGDRDQ